MVPGSQFQNYYTSTPSSSSLSEEQERTLAILMILSGCLSALGSFSIMRRIWNSSRKVNSYDRIMFGLGSFNMIASVTYILTPFLLPTDGPSPRVYASGSAVSCSILGWLTQFSYATATYNCALSFYFLAIIKYRINIDDFAIRFEAYIHGLTVLFFLLTATCGVPFQMYDEMEMGMYCWIKNDFPNRCNGEECFGDTIGWVYGGAIVIFAFFVLPINQFQIWFQIRRKLSAFQGGTNPGQGNSDNPIFAIRIRRSVTQVGLYMLAFYLTNTTTIVLRILEQSFGYTASKEREIFGLLVAHSSLVPLNGFLIALIHARPNYIKLRASEFPIGTSIWLAFWQKDVEIYLDGPGAEASRYSSSIHGSRCNDSKSKQEAILINLEDTIRFVSEHIIEDAETALSKQTLRQLSMTAVAAQASQIDKVGSFA